MVGTTLSFCYSVSHLATLLATQRTYHASKRDNPSQSSYPVLLCMRDFYLMRCPFQEV